MARILLTTFGSYGDLFPYLAIGRELRDRGHRIAIATIPAYRPRIEQEGFSFRPVRPDAALDDREMLAYVMDKRRGSERVVRYLCSTLRETYEDTLAAAREADLIVSHPVTFASVLVAQKLRMPWVSTVLAPILFFSAWDPPVPAPFPWIVKLRVFGPGFMKRVWDSGRRESLRWLQPVAELRRELGLDPGEHPLFEGAHSPAMVLALFSSLLAKPQPDWPPQTRVTGFPFYDPRGDEGLSPDLRHFLDEGPPPVVFTLGSSAVGAAGDFYRESLEAVRRLGARAVFLTGPHPQGLPEPLPAGSIAVAYAPHAQILPRAAAIVHQGGIGTTAQAMRAGKPMLVVPFGHDQYDNGARVRRLGAGEALPRSSYNARRAARALGGLLETSAYAQEATRLGSIIATETGARNAAEAICTLA